MKEKYKDLPLRSGVGIVVLNDKNKVLVAKRIDNPKNFWQMPQGGVGKGENFYEAALRELKEETSIVSVKLIKEIQKKFIYILPDNLIGIIWKGKFKGQKQKWFVMRFVGNESEINIKTKHPEFLDWKWIDLEDLSKIAVNFKLEMYNKVKLEVKKIVTQGEFLQKLGIIERANILSKKISFKAKADMFYRLKKLLHYKEMGNLFKVLFARKKGTKFSLGFQ